MSLISRKRKPAHTKTRASNKTSQASSGRITPSAEKPVTSGGALRPANQSPTTRGQKIFLPLISILILLVLLEGGTSLLIKTGTDESAGGVRFEVNEVWNHGGNSFHKPDQDLFWVARPGFSGGEIRINQLGFRGEDVSTKRPGVCRIVLLGNSVTFGYGVSETETYASVLNQFLNQRLDQLTHAGIESIEVINAGTVGYTSWQGRQLFDKSIRSLKPDLVVASYGYNDHHSAQISDVEKSAGSNLNTLLAEFRRTSLYKYVHRLRGNQDPRLRQKPVPRVSLSEFTNNLLAIESGAAEIGAECVFITPALREGKPLVENFCPVDFSDQRVWMRQIDFAIGSLGLEYKDELLEHFVKNRSIDSFCAQDQNAAALIELTSQYPDLPIFHYLLAQCCRVKGVTEGYAPEMAAASHLDLERAEMTAYHETLRDLSRSGQLQLLDIADTFSRSAEDSLFIDVIHPTPKGHQLIARMLGERIITLLNH